MSVASEKPRPTLDQQRARHAWEAVLRAKKRQGDHERQDPKKFGGQAKKLPVRIMASGLGQAIVFLKAKDYAPGLVAEISDWIATRVPLRPDEPRAKPDRPPDLLERIIRGDSDFLRRATDEVLAYLQWLRRFAEAEGLTEGDGE